MKLVLLRHAIAEDRLDFYRSNPGAPDSERPLTSDGIKKMKLGAMGLVNALDYEIQRVISSPYTRARQTAEIFLEAIPQKQRPELEFSDILAMGYSSSEIANWLAGDTGTIVLVGHEPDMSNLMEQFCSRSSPLHLKFGKGGACLIEFLNGPLNSIGILRWFMSPKMLRKLSCK